MAQKHDDVVSFFGHAYNAIDGKNVIFKVTKQWLVSLGADTTIRCRSYKDAQELAWEIKDISNAPDTGMMIHRPEISVSEEDGYGVVHWKAG